MAGSRLDSRSCRPIEARAFAPLLPARFGISGLDRKFRWSNS